MGVHGRDLPYSPHPNHWVPTQTHGKPTHVLWEITVVGKSVALVVITVIVVAWSIQIVDPRWIRLISIFLVRIAGTLNSVTNTRSIGAKREVTMNTFVILSIDIAITPVPERAITSFIVCTGTSAYVLLKTIYPIGRIGEMVIRRWWNYGVTICVIEWLEYDCLRTSEITTIQKIFRTFGTQQINFFCQFAM